MKRFSIAIFCLVLAGAVFFGPAAGSFNLYHYYYTCPEGPSVYVHKGVLKMGDGTYLLNEESDQKWEYVHINEWEIKSRYGKGTATRVYIGKGTNRITYGWGVYECTVVKSIFKK